MLIILQNGQAPPASLRAGSASSTLLLTFRPLQRLRHKSHSADSSTSSAPCSHTDSWSDNPAPGNRRPSYRRTHLYPAAKCCSNISLVREADIRRRPDPHPAPTTPLCTQAASPHPQVPPGSSAPTHPIPHPSPPSPSALHCPPAKRAAANNTVASPLLAIVTLCCAPLTVSKPLDRQQYSRLPSQHQDSYAQSPASVISSPFSMKRGVPIRTRTFLRTNTRLIADSRP